MLKDKISRFAGQNIPAVVMALVFALLIIAPTVSSIAKIGWSNFQGVYPVLSDDETHYLAMAREMREGHNNLGNVFFFEHKQAAEIMSSWPSRLLAVESIILRLSIPATFFVNDFFAVFFGCLALYGLLYSITLSRRAALFGAAGFYALFLFSFNRPVVPQLAIMLFYCGLWLIWIITTTGETADTRRSSLLLGLCVGLLAYVYPYYWTPLLVAYCLLLANHLASKKYQRIGSVVSFALACLPFFLPYVWQMISASRQAEYADTVSRLGLISTHWPACYLNIGLLAACAALLVIMRSRIVREKFQYAITLVVAGMAVNWSNVMTGKYLQFSSHYYMITVLIILIALAITFPALIAGLKTVYADRVWHRARMSLLIGAALYLLLAGVIVYKQKNDILSGLKLITGVSASDMAQLQSYRPLFDWLNDQAPADSVVMVLDNKLSDFIPVYTAENLYSYGYGGAYLVSDQEMERRWIAQKLVQGVKTPDISLIKQENRSIWFNSMIDSYQNRSMRNKLLSYIGIDLPEPEMFDKRLARTYDAWQDLKSLPLREVIKPFRLDYYIDSCGRSENYERLRFSSGGLCVFQD